MFSLLLPAYLKEIETVHKDTTDFKNHFNWFSLWFYTLNPK